MSQVNVVKIYRTLNDAQKQRIDSHAATVFQNPDGTLATTVDTILTPDGNEKTNKIVSVIPSAEEKVYKFQDAKVLFQDLAHMNLLLTNACNLSCSYCYEQHNKDFGRFTDASLRQAYDWLKDINKQPLKIMQFFGGEPLIHKKIIKSFIDTHHCELDRGWHGYSGVGLSICTNGILLDDEFINMYFSKRYTHMLISLDTLDLEKDYREITPEQLDEILTNIEKITAIPSVGARLTVRCTLSEETADTLESFVESMYQRGVKRLIIHPLILDSRRGYIKWSDENWQTMRSALFNCLDRYDDLTILFSEGVGEKESNNCMVGSDMIAIDASGDFSGCYFFTNHKGGATAETVLGNIFHDKVYIDRYKKFQDLYNTMFEEEEQCKTCDYKNACYQCPAGNVDTGPKMFRPDDMCQKIVKLYLDLQADVSKKHFQKMFKLRLIQLEHDGEQQTMASGGESMLHYLKTGERLMFDQFTKGPHRPQTEIFGDIWTQLSGVDTPSLTAEQLYVKLCNKQGIPPKIMKEDTAPIRVFYLQLISTMLFEQKWI